ncbi:SVEP1-like protein [Mya arenaria]|uniref:SVEP1-like protein n=1 Tax=Mya arenaria TaxID=6604 RepID=A0ABY7FDH5_MYAAR|nr:SVEP1-like protein [Mya arenaria]
MQCRHSVVPGVTLFLFYGLCSVAALSPLTYPYRRYDADGGGCDFKSLPAMVDWCDNSLNKRGLLPENTKCQSLETQELKIVCRRRRWILSDDAEIVRHKRSLSAAYRARFNKTCLFLCPSDDTAPDESPPHFLSCPASVILYPEEGSTIVTYDWQVPEATSTHKNITSFEQILGQNSSTDLASSISPGTNHLVTYVTWDDDNMNWTCSFTITAEIPTCPPLVHLKNGRTNCTDDNRRASTCEFLCNHGYQLNGTVHTQCLHNGTWSDMELASQCLPRVCDDDVSSLLVNPRLKADCGNASHEFGVVCWLSCADKFRLRNDPLEAQILDQLNYDVTNATAQYEISRQNADIVLEQANRAATNLTLREKEIERAVNESEAAQSELQVVLANLEQTVHIVNNTQELLHELNNNLTTAAEEKIHNLTGILAEYNNALETIQESVYNLTVAYNWTLDYLTIKQEEAFVAAQIVNETSQRATELDADATYLLEVLQNATVTLMEATEYSAGNEKVVPTPVTCMGDGGWHMPGNPTCVDIDAPVLKCIPAYTQILDTGLTSSEITWIVPEVEDNGDDTQVLQMSGTSPGSLLALGSHVVTYQAVDSVLQCEDIGHLIKDGHVLHECDTFEIGGRCELSCDNNYVLSGPEVVTCEWTEASQTAEWDLQDTACIVEQCAPPSPPANGNIECTYGRTIANDTSDNVTDANVTSAGNVTLDGLTCVYTCDEGYVLPYRTPATVTCDEEGVWSLEDFPDSCIETGEEKISTFTFLMNVNTASCTSDDLNVTMTQWSEVLTAEMTSLYACMSGFTCGLGDIASGCADDSVVIQFTIQIGCEIAFPTNLPWETTCDLNEDVTALLMTSLVQIVDDIGLFGGAENVMFVQNETALAFCYPGSILIGSYCSKCEPGRFYSPYWDACRVCEPGSYANVAGRTFCTNCPGQSTLYNASTSKKQCTDVCPAGEYSQTGLVPCSPCPAGTYQAGSRSDTCSHCPVATWTIGTASQNQDECIEYDIYFDGDAQDIPLPSVSGDVSFAFWFRSFYVPMVTVSVGFNNGASAFTVKATSSLEMEILNKIVQTSDVMVEMGQWMMIGVTFSASYVTLYVDGESIIQTSANLDDIEAYSIRLAVGNTTYISGLSLSNQTASSGDMEDVWSVCGRQLPAAVYTLDDLAALRLIGMNYVYSTCRPTNESLDADHCGLHECQHGGVCVPHVTDAGHTCNCLQPWGGPFCGELLVSGGWGEWVWASSCSASCGPGTRLRYRLCDSPPHSEHGADCPGTSTEVMDCVLQECQECEDISGDGVVTCTLDDDECTPACPPGYVLPRGQANQHFQCGYSTDFRWAPLHRLPICTESIKPTSYTVTFNFAFTDPVPCEAVSMVTSAYQQVVATLRCPAELDDCSASAEITGCVDGRRKRDTRESQLEVVLMALLKNETIDLIEYYSTNNMTPSIEDAVVALSVLEQTVNDVQADPALFTVIVDDVNYTVVMDTMQLVPGTHCGDGQVPVEAVCARCQMGTYLLEGRCVYCPRGTYQDLAGQSACIPCPTGQDTDFLGARDSTECIVLIVVASVAGGCFLLLLVALVFACRRAYIGAWTRALYNLNADRLSLYTDNQDMPFNVYFKRRKIGGFDRDGHPTLAPRGIRRHDGHPALATTGDCKLGSHTNFPNNTLKHGSRRGRDKSDTSSSDSSSSDSDDSSVGNVNTDRDAKPFVQKFPVLDRTTPFSYDPCIEQWNDSNVNPYSYPELDRIDLPRIGLPSRYRIPGKKHFQNIYPVEQFGLGPDSKTRTQLVVHVPVVAKKPVSQLMHRPQEKPSYEQIYGVKIQDEHSNEQGIEINPTRILQQLANPPPLPTKKNGKPRSMKTKKPASVAQRSNTFSRPSPNTVYGVQDKRLSWIRQKLLPPVRKTAEFTPRTPGRMAADEPTPRTARDVDLNIHDLQNGNIQNGGPTIVTIQRDFTQTPKSLLRMLSGKSESFSGRKSVTILDDQVSILSHRHSMKTPGFYPNGSMNGHIPTREHQDMLRPSSRPSFLPDIHEREQLRLPDHRSITPVEHPKPVLHSGVSVKRTSSFLPNLNGGDEEY